ncbi:thylakoid membrane protein TERC, chloroplastic isoform X2 [Camellia sinensis]|uniref:thylakoid membrane protein TERC, chloroplastic isoform X2 n=1 Tax=Camellia sinensis TaxID=4442 RepID=UPI001035F6F9|nr:thylakoid membrane protein TERC, chloroplastic isoform X2 [Camellia sinensis]
MIQYPYMIQSMGLTSVIYNGVQVPPKFDSSFLRVSPTSPPFQPPKSSRIQFSQFPFHTSHSVRNRFRRGYCLPIACLRGTEQEEGLSNSEGDIPGSRSSHGINNVETSHITSSSNLKENKSRPEIYASSVRAVALCVCTAVAFGIGLGLKDGVGKASEFFAGYLLEQSLSVDNLFVFVLIFKYFKVPIMYQSKVLSYGIAGAIVFRLSIILLGTATLQLFAVEEEDSDLSDNFIVKTCQKFIPVTSNYDGNRFITIQDGVWKATPLLLTVAVIELSDIAFAVDSIPAVFGVTRDPFVVFTSNFFAILGLRSLYTLISKGMADLEYLQPSIAVVLGFIGFKMILDFFGYHVSTEVSLGFVATTLSSGVLLSLMKNSNKN